MSTSARMLQLLSLLQTHRFWPGTELADRLEVSPRTLRRDVDRLRELGYHVDAVRGVAGGYQLQAGGSMPPVLLTDDEAVAIAVGLRSAAAGSVSGVEETSVQALTKVISLMPPRLRRRMDALKSQTEALSFGEGATLDARTLTTLAQVCRDDELLEFGYTAAGGARTRRRVEPLRLVNLGRRWYLVAYDRKRHDWRSFRVDRISRPTSTGQRFRPRELPADDAVTFVREGIRERPQRYQVRVLLETAAGPLQERLGRWATVEPDGDDRCVLTAQIDDLGWAVLMLTAADCDFTVEEPADLVGLLGRLGRRFTAAAGR